MIESVTLASASPWWWLLSLSLMAVGVAGAILPVLPGTVLVLAGAALGAWIDGLREAGLYDQVWQAGAILLPVRSVGVMGDERTYENAVALRAVSSR